MNDLKTGEWNQSYGRNENFIFYPKEEVVKFLNRFVRKKIDVKSLDSNSGSHNKIKALDLGCGIGRQTILFKEFDFEPFGVDISEVAIQQAKELSRSFGYDLDKNFMLLDDIKLPFEDSFFDFAISDSVLDSMEFRFAKMYMSELNRTVKNLLYLNLISSDSEKEGKAEDILVYSEHEKGTIQSYYNIDRIQELIKDTDFEIIQLNKNTIQNLLTQQAGARFNIVLKKK